MPSGSTPPIARRRTARPTVSPGTTLLDGVVEAVSQAAGIGSIDRDAFTNVVHVTVYDVLTDDGAHTGGKDGIALAFAG